MRLCEIFYSIQGEGPAMGRPAAFVRLAGCNLFCEGCDTHLSSWSELSLREVLEQIQGDRVIITGGEPTLQMQELTELVSLLYRSGKEIHIETNGTMPIPEEVLKMIRCAVISPKRGSEFHLGYWSGMENVHLKFVIGEREWCWTGELLEDLLPALPRRRVWVMPFGSDMELQGAREAWDLALRLGINYSDRLHIRLKGR